MLAVCDAEFRGGLSGIGLLVAAGYGAWLWAAVLRRPSEVRRRALLAFVPSAIAGAAIVWPLDDAFLLRALVAVLVGTALALGVVLLAGAIGTSALCLE